MFRTLRLCVLLSLLGSLGAAAQSTSPDLLPMPLTDLSGFQTDGSNWQIAGGVTADRTRERALDVQPGTGVLVNTAVENASGDNIFTAWEHGDLELELEFVMPQGSNSGVYLQGRYEVQLFDSWGVPEPTYSDAGGLYERWDESRPEGQKGFEGHPPAVNVSRAPGLWQHFRILFQAPRFDGQGQKTTNARFLEVWHNGVQIHDDVELTGPTRAAAFTDEQPMGPVMLQGDHGPVAFRNIRYKPLITSRVEVAGSQYRYYEGEFEEYPNFSRLSPKKGAPTDSLTWSFAEARNDLALVFDGTLRVPETDTYTFRLATMGGGRLYIDNRLVIDHDGDHRYDEKGNLDPGTGSVRLSAGDHPYTLGYVKSNVSWIGPEVRLSVASPSMPWHELTTPPARFLAGRPQPMLVEPADEPVIFRSFIDFDGKKRTHVVSVGDPSGIHYAVDLHQAAGLLYVWKGDFLNVTPMWHQRGEAQTAEPRGSTFTLSGRPTLARLSAPDSAWPDSLPDYRFTGYHLDDEGRPTFRYTLGGIEVEDRLVPAEEGRYLTRTLTLEAPPATDDLWLFLAEGRSITAGPDGSYSVDDNTYYIELPPGGPDPVIRPADGGEALLLNIPFSGTEASVAYSIVW